MRLAPLTATFSFAVLALAACGGGTTEPGTDRGETTTVAVAASDDACIVETTDLAAGQVTFAVTNEGKQVTEVYVYGEGDRVIGEVENIGPGLARDLVVTLDGGSYEVACKPGQTGSGIRTSVTVTGDLGIERPEAGRGVEIEGTEYAFSGVPSEPFEIGETIDFELVNAGDEVHEMEVFGPDGELLGEVGPTDAGADGHVVLTLKAPGTYRLVCGIEDHEAKGMAATFEVA